MPNTFGIESRPIGVAKYTQENLKPLDSADLARYFNMSVQKKALEKEDNRYKTDVLKGVGDLFKEIDPLPKDMGRVNSLLDPLRNQIQNLKTTEDYSKFASQVSKTLLDNVIISSMGERKAFDKHTKWAQDNLDSKELAKFYTDINSRATIDDPNAPNSIASMDLSPYAIAPNLKEQATAQQILASEAAVENSTANTQANIADKEYKQGLIKEQMENKAYDNDARAKALEISPYFDSSDAPAEVKAQISAMTRQAKPDWPTIYGIMAAYGKGYANNAAIRDGVSAANGKYPPGTRGSTGDVGVDDILNTPNVTYKDKVTGQNVSTDVKDKDGVLEAKAKLSQSGRYMQQLHSIDEEGNVFAFSPILQGGGLGKNVDDEADDTEGFWGNNSGSWAHATGMETADHTDIQPQGGLQKVLNNYGSQSVKNYYTKNGSKDETDKNKYYIKYGSQAAGQDVEIYADFVPENLNSNSEVQKGYLKTNNPQIIQKYYKEMVESGLRDNKWFGQHVKARDTREGIEYRIKDQIWSAKANIENADPEQMKKYIRLAATGSTFTPKELKLQAEAQKAAQEQALKVSGVANYVPWEGASKDKTALATNRQLNEKINYEFNKPFLDKIAANSKIMANEPLASFAKMDPEIVSFLSGTINTEDPEDMKLLEAITDVADDARDDSSDHNVGRGLDIRVRNGDFNASNALLRRILSKWPSVIVKDSKGQERMGSVYYQIEGPNKEEIEKTRSLYKLPESVKAKPNPKIANHIHISFRVSTAAPRKPTALDNAVVPGSVIDTSGMGELDIH